MPITTGYYWIIATMENSWKTTKTTVSYIKKYKLTQDGTMTVNIKESRLYTDVFETKKLKATFYHVGKENFPNHKKRADLGDVKKVQANPKAQIQ